MAKFVATDVRVEINGVNLSDHVSGVAPDLNANEVDVSSMGSGWTQVLAGLKDASVTVTFFQDFAAASVHQTLNPLFQAGSSFTVKIRPTTGAISATNPELQMTAVMLSYPFLDAAVGDAPSLDITFRNAATAGPVIAVV